MDDVSHTKTDKTACSLENAVWVRAVRGLRGVTSFVSSGVFRFPLLDLDHSGETDRRRALAGGRRDATALYRRRTVCTWNLLDHVNCCDLPCLTTQLLGTCRQW